MPAFSFTDDFQNFGQDDVFFPNGRTYTRTLDVSAAADADVSGSGTFTLEAFGDFSNGNTGGVVIENVTVSIEGIPLGRFLSRDETDDRFEGPPGDAGDDYGNEGLTPATGVATLTEAEIEGIIADGTVEITYTMGSNVHDLTAVFKTQEYLEATLAFTAEVGEPIGGNGGNTVVGAGADDQLFGDDGDDLLRGLGGDDRLEGGRGDDRLEGGGGDDLFVLTRPSGTDTILDFGDGDMIRLVGFRQVDGFEDLTVTRAGGDTTIGFSGGTVILADYTGPVAADDFLFG
jgi:Ca2+-binding RTX toxin-like protein